MKQRLLLSLAVLLSIVIQVAVFPHLRLLGVVPEVGLLVAVAVAYRLGSATGAVVGFAAGLGYDLFLETPLGLSALAWLLTAWAVGAFHAGLVRPPRFIAPILGGLAGIMSGLLFVAIGIIFGVEELRDVEVLGVIARVSLYDALIAPLVFLATPLFIVDKERAPSELW